jgi:methylenetetrahydrofolate dehydrogenase (NADP+)/methenyltetrahydrofolate cyclohydrolase
MPRLSTYFRVRNALKTEGEKICRGKGKILPSKAFHTGKIDQLEVDIFAGFWEKSSMLKILAKPVTDEIHAKVKLRADAFFVLRRRKPKLSVVLVGEDPASVIYTRRKGEAALAVGMEHESVKLPATSTPSQVHAVIQRLNQDPSVDGILIQRPLPKGFKEEDVLYWVTPEKDVDAFHPINTGRLVLGLPTFAPCTPAGVMELLKYYQLGVAGKNVCIIGRSSIVGKPMAALLLHANATIFHCHSQTVDLPSISSRADIVIAAIGRPEFIGAEHVRDGAIVIDVGINRRADGKIVGDVAFDAVAEKAHAITPVPGGVGPMTIALLLQNTVWAAEQRG